jgi:hypothetical protein
MVKEVLTMSHQELDRLEVLKLIEDKRINQIQGAKQLDLSTRQLRRIQLRYNIDGAKGLISKHRGRISNNKFSDEFKLEIADLIKENYHDFKPTFAHEKLIEIHHKKLSVESTRKIMIEHGIWQAKIKKRQKVFQRRAPRSRFGELIQIDGSPHDWFEGRAPNCTLLVFIDDATSAITDLRFNSTENTQGYMELMNSHIKKYGRPQALYSDQHSVFIPNYKIAKDRNVQTQFYRAIQTLDIKLILAKSPQAKGRVERANKTLQDRLVKEMRLNNINNIEQANEYLERFRLDHNTRFAKAPINKDNAHRELLHSSRELDLILSIHKKRRTTKSLEFTYHKQVYQIDKKATHVINKTVTLCKLASDELVVVYAGIELDYKVFGKKTPQIVHADEKTINYCTDELLKNPTNPSYKLAVDTCISENI